MTVEQVCRLRRTAAALTISAAALERTLVRHQQKPVPFFGTVLADGIDIAALAAGWGGPGSPGDDGEGLGADLDVRVGVPVNQLVPAARQPPGRAPWGRPKGPAPPSVKMPHRVKRPVAGFGRIWPGRAYRPSPEIRPRRWNQVQP